jgi:hypothetical protein
MATLTFSYDTGNVSLSRIVEALAVAYHYQVTIPDPQNPNETIPNPESKAAFGRRMIKELIIEQVRKGEHMAAMAAVQTIEPIDMA